jgi:hypothetical protein
MPPKPYLNVIIFPRSLHFRNAALGFRRKVKIGQLAGHLILPRANNEEIGKSFSKLLPPRVSRVDYAIKVHNHVHQGEYDGKLRWGGYFAHNTHDPINTAIAGVHAAVLALSPMEGDRIMSVSEVGEACIAQLPRWSSILTDWIEVLTGADLNSTHPLQMVVSPERWTTAAWIHSAGSRSEYTFVNGSFSLMGSDGKDAMGAQEWSTAIRAANEGRDIPEVWALIRDARAAILRHSGRRAVLDAATAVELIVGRELRRELLRTNSARFTEQLLKKTWQVSRRVEMMADLDMWLPRELDANVMSLRNGVIHSNALVTKAQASAAVETADALLRHYTPIAS